VPACPDRISSACERTIILFCDAILSEKLIDDRTVEHVWDFGSAKVTARGVLSSDGKTMTHTITGTNPKGEQILNVEIYKRQ
jgi:hypothetical protein